MHYKGDSKAELAFLVTKHIPFGYITDELLLALVTQEMVEIVRRELAYSGSGIAILNIPEFLLKVLGLTNDQATALVRHIMEHPATAPIFNDLPDTIEGDKVYIGKGNRCVEAEPNIRLRNVHAFATSDCKRAWRTTTRMHTRKVTSPIQT